MHRLKRGFALLLCLPLLTGCGGKKAPILPEVEETEAENSTALEMQALAPEVEDLTVWSAYWDCADDIDVLEEEADHVDAVSLFAAYFQDGELVIPDTTDRMRGKIRRRDVLQEKTVYLSVVNDVKEGDKITQKDTDILWQVLGTEEAAQAHAQELVQLAVDNGYDGIEIDYEKIRKDMELWQAFISFEEELLPLAKDAGLQVRILLEPGTPVEQLTFPEGAEYVVMCYNLFGGGTGPGPKADMAFLKELYEKFQTLPNCSYALANGGYIWEGTDTKATQCRASEAKALAQKAGVTPERDPDSGALHFNYTQDGTSYTVWYADETTLARWAQQLQEVGGGKVRVSLWRL